MAEEKKSSEIKPDFLRCEYLINPIGIDVSNPRLSWTLASEKRAQRQTAFQILVASSRELLNKDVGDLWDSGRVYSDDSIHVKYQGKELHSHEFCYWKVRIWDQDGNPSAWSDVAFWSMGILHQDEWKARWIGSSKKKKASLRMVIPKLYYQPCDYLRKEFFINGKIERAILHASSLGEHEIFINGKKVGDHLLAPEWTDYEKRVQYQSHDVTNLLRNGNNAIGAVLADGWYSGNLGPGIIFIHDYYGKTRHFIACLRIEMSDGSIKEVLTDSTWKISRNGPIRQADHFQGEFFIEKIELN
ncbi:MAG: alpha-L-rhamnosidase N-terminal domain-containing protein, partial [Candidatus Helarchaeales archaeon]